MSESKGVLRLFFVILLLCLNAPVGAQTGEKRILPGPQGADLGADEIDPAIRGFLDPGQFFTEGRG